MNTILRDPAGLALQLSVQNRHLYEVEHARHALSLACPDFSTDRRIPNAIRRIQKCNQRVEVAIQALGDYGRPSAIRLVVLADRGHRELPIQPDATGFVFQTEKNDRIQVRMKELEEVDEILLLPGGNR